MSEKFGGEIRKAGWEAPHAETFEDSVRSIESAMQILQGIKEFLVRHGAPLDGGQCVLEVGSGKGYLLQALRKENIDVVGVDARPRDVESGRLVGARIEQLPFANESFDTVLSEGVFAENVYVQDQEKMLAEIARVLKKGGVFLRAGASEFNATARPYVAGLQLVSGPLRKYGLNLYRKG